MGQWSGARSPDPATEKRPEPEHRAGISTRCGAAPLPHSVRDLSRDQNTERHREETQSDMSTLASLPALLETQKVCSVLTVVFMLQ